MVVVSTEFFFSELYQWVHIIVCIYSTVGDIHQELEITVYKISSRSNEQLLGKIKMPIHRVCAGNFVYLLKH